MTIEKAFVSDHTVLTEITKKSKAYWGYSDKQIELWSELLTITATYLETREAYKLIIDGKIIGYYSYFNQHNDTVRLDNLFILPNFIGKGFGQALIQDFLSRLKRTDRIVVLESEPNAEGFYAKFGFIKTGQTKTSIKSRYLPIMELTLNTL